MKIKILAEFQKTQLFRDNMSVGWQLENDNVIDDNNKFHFFKYQEVDTTWDFERNVSYIFPIFLEYQSKFINELVKFVEDYIELFTNRKLVPVFLDPLEGNANMAYIVDYFVNYFHTSIPTYYISSDHKLKNRTNLFKFLYVEQWQQHLDAQDILTKYTPGKDYINLNRMPRLHRCILMQKIIDNNLLRNGYNTWANANWKDSLQSNRLFERFKMNNPDTTIANQTYDTLDFEDIGSANPTAKTPMRFCENSFIYIVTETHVDNESFFISEKSYKPISIGMPFMILGNPGTLEFLREKGYVTFSDWIDESYDCNIPLEKRIAIMIENLRTIAKMDDLTKINVRKEMEKICKHNLDLYRLLNKKNNFIENLKLIERNMVRLEERSS